MMGVTGGRSWRRAAMLAWAAVLTACVVSAAGGDDVDAMFRHARELAFAGDHETARAVAREILEAEPEYVEVAVFLARLDAWDGDYDGAARQLDAILAAHPDSVEARLALVDVDIWRGRLRDAAAGCEAVLAMDPDDTEALARRRRIAELVARREAERAAGVGSPAGPMVPGTRRRTRASAGENANRSWAVTPGPATDEEKPGGGRNRIGARATEAFAKGRNASTASGAGAGVEGEATQRRAAAVNGATAEAAEAFLGPTVAQRGALPVERRGYRAGLEYQIEDFDRDFNAWHQIAASLEKRASWGTVIGRVNYFSRFGDNAFQFDAEAYRDIARGMYVNLAGTVATDSVLPDYSALIELYRALPYALEGSAGIRFIGFDSPTRVYTASLGIYRGNYWAIVRPLVTSNNLGTTVSWSAKVRRYFRDEEEYATLTLTRGRELEGTSSSLDLFKLDTTAALLELRKRVAPRYIVKARGGYQVQELPGRTDRGKILFGIGLEYLF